MAERLPESFTMPVRRGRPRKYPWNQWFDGAYWKLTAGVDFQLKIDNFRRLAASHASRHGLRMQSSKVSETELIIRAFPRSS